MNFVNLDVIVIGAGAAGLMCAIEAGKRNKKVLVIDHYKKPAEKIRISGGGFCNFTNAYTSEKNFLSQNPHFFKSALKRYTPENFINLMQEYNIPFYEKKAGQLFCENSSKDIIEMLLNECSKYNVEIQLNTKINKVKKFNNEFSLFSESLIYKSSSLVIASGGLSVPKIGASNFGYKIAEQFNLPITELSPALVPITFDTDLLEHCKSLSRVSLNAKVIYENSYFQEGFLFTHKGLSGPSILQISSYWKYNNLLKINLKPEVRMNSFIKKERENYPKRELSTILSQILPKRLTDLIIKETNINSKLGELSNANIEIISKRINEWLVYPTGTEGYRTAEVTLGGINTDCLSSKTMEVKTIPRLYFIGEVVDVTGHLGGHNFQWAWSSGWVAGQYV